MKPVLIFSGTTEGRKLAELLAENGLSATVCVATEYGGEVMDPVPGIQVHKGRMGKKEMQERMAHVPVVVDATHPFATEVSENIRESAKKAGIRYLRLQRDTKRLPSKDPESADVFYFPDNQSCAEALCRTTGKVLLTIGSKGLPVYCCDEALKDRLFARVLPNEESIALCRQQGLKRSQIIAMQGPFSEEMNIALSHQYGIRHIVTKESGSTGGFYEKASAAKTVGASLYVIGNPEKEKGFSFDEVCGKLEEMAGVRLGMGDSVHISLVGIGMGGSSTLTREAEAQIDAADYLFGAARMLECAKAWKHGKAGHKEYPFYRAEDIIPVLESIVCGQTEISYGKTVRIAVLFSGDSGFYSGCQNMYQELASWKERQDRNISVRIYPGISSVSYLAAALGISWQDAGIISIHGWETQRGWAAKVLEAIRRQKKVFLLVSGLRDVRMLGTLLLESGLADSRIFLGYQLSYPEEKIVECTPESCMEIQEEGLYAVCVLRENTERKYLAPYKKDSEFIRGKIPMTKEEVRELSVCKLRLVKDAVVYDIGSGTGSVAVEIAERSATIRVYAIEQKDEGVALLHQNKKKFHLQNLEVIQGTAPDILHSLPIPSHAFIGGSGGRMKEILETLRQKKRGIRVVITAVTLETVGEITEILQNLQVEDEEIIQLQVDRAEKIGRYHLMRAENPVYLCSFTIK